MELQPRDYKIDFEILPPKLLMPYIGIPVALPSVDLFEMEKALLLALALEH